MSPLLFGLYLTVKSDQLRGLRKGIVDNVPADKGRVHALLICLTFKADLRGYGTREAIDELLGVLIQSDMHLYSSVF
jgi:hypothetical protein